MRSVRINVTPRAAPGQRIGAIDELKGVAIALIIVYHSEGLLGDPSILHGEVGVDIFLILSGFTLAMNSAAMPLGRFLTRRFLRIYPAYWLALGVTLWIMKKYYVASFGWEDIWLHVAGLHGFSRPAYFSDISDPFWFISLIVGAYLAFACIRRRLDDLSLVVAVAGGLSVLAAVAYQHFGNIGGVVQLTVRIPSFFAGIIAGRLLCAGTAELRFNLALGLGLLCFYYLTFFRAVTDPYTLPALGIIAAWLGLRHAIVGTLPGRALLGVFSLLGIISYEVYLFHQPIIRDYNSWVWAHELGVLAPNHAQLLKGIFVGLGVSFAIAAAVHLVLGWAFGRLAPRTRSPAAAAP